MKNAKSGSILILVGVITLLLLSTMLLYNQLTQSSLFDIGKKIGYIKCKNEINNTIKALKKIFETESPNNCDSFHDFWLASPLIFNLNDIELTIKIKDEDSKINLNLLLYPDGKINNFIENKTRNVLMFNKINPDFTNAFIDWIDPDNIELPQGAENDYYKNQPPKLQAPNTFFSTKDELKLLKNIGVYFDESDDSNIYLSEFFTVYGDNKYNINTVSDTVLRSFDILDNVEITALLEFRKKFPIKDLKILTDLIPELQKQNFDLIDNYLKTTSDILNIAITARYQKYIFKCEWIYNRQTRETLMKKNKI